MDRYYYHFESNDSNGFDNYLKSKGEIFVMKKHQIQPSDNFTKDTLQKIREAHKHRVFMTRFIFTSYFIVPLIMREIWNWTRNDYFAVGSWPLGEYMVAFYNFINADSLRVYVWALGVSAALIYLWGYRLIFAPFFKRVGHIFTRDQRARA